MNVLSTLCLCTLIFLPISATGAPVCHLHAPNNGDNKQNQESPSQWLQQYEHHDNNLKACEQDNARRFSGLGRCHCSFSRLPGMRAPSGSKPLPLDPSEGLDRQIP